MLQVHAAAKRPLRRSRRATCPASEDRMAGRTALMGPVALAEVASTLTVSLAVFVVHVWCVSEDASPVDCVRVLRGRLR